MQKNRFKTSVQESQKLKGEFAEVVLTKNHLRNVAVVLLVERDGDTLAIVPDGYHVLLRLDFHLDQIHRLVSLKVVGGIHQNLICKKRPQKLTSNVRVIMERAKKLADELTKYFVEAGDVFDLTKVEFLGGLVEDPKLLEVVLDTADVSVGA